MRAADEPAPPQAGVAASPDPSAPFAVRPVAVIAGVAAAVLLARAGRYDFFGDELYFLAAGRRLAVGYVDQGPLVPLVARTASALAPGSLVVLRVPAIAAGVAAIAVAAATARELGGGCRAQVLAALAYATCPFLVTQTATLSTFAFDATLSAMLVLLSIRWARRGGHGPVLGAAVVVALDLQVKLLVPVLLAGLGAGVLLLGPRALPRGRALWPAVALVVAAAAPSLLWQAAHGWPQVAMGPVIRTEQSAATGGFAAVPIQVAMMAGLLGISSALCGCLALCRWSRLRPYRFVAVAVAVQAGFLIVSGGRPYYLAGLLPVLFASGAVWFEAREAGIRTLRAAMAVSAVIVLAVVLILPLPASRMREPGSTPAALSSRMRVYGPAGWRDLVAGVEAVSVAVGDRAHTVIVTQTYWQAAAVDELGGPDLPPVFSPNRGFALLGVPPDTATTAIYVGRSDAGAALRELFSRVDPGVVLADPHGFPGVSRGVTVWKCARPRHSWADLWSATASNAMDQGLGKDTSP